MKATSNIDLTRLNTFGITAHADRLIEISSEKDVFTALGQGITTPILVMGGGSNILFTRNFEGTVLLNRIRGLEVIQEDESNVWLRIGAGENWHEVVQYSIQNNWGGIENLSLIPGCAGAAPIQNIGAYGVEIKDVLESVQGIIFNQQELRVFDADACEFGYRDSIFKRGYKGKIIITYIVLKLTKQHTLKTAYGDIRRELAEVPEDRWTIHHVSDAVIKIRSSKLPNPSILGNAGSFFKNPTIRKSVYHNIKEQFPDLPGYEVSEEEVKLAAGWLIEQCGWKGKRVGATGCHEKQALVLVNYGGASGIEIRDHAMAVIRSVKARFGIELEAEVNII